MGDTAVSAVPAAAIGVDTGTDRARRAERPGAPGTDRRRAYHPRHGGAEPVFQRMPHLPEI